MSDTNPTPPAEWDEYAMLQARRIASEVQLLPPSQAAARIHCALVDAIRFGTQEQARQIRKVLGDPVAGIGLSPRASGRQWLLIGGPRHGQTIWIKHGNSITTQDSAGGQHVYEGVVTALGESRYMLGVYTGVSHFTYNFAAMILETKLQPIAD